jgi:hypothetical protein
MTNIHAGLTRTYQHLSRFLPASIAGRLDWHFSPNLAQRFGGPFNGQSGRTEIFHQILRAIPFQAVVETGTYVGTTTLYLQKNSMLPVYTVEAVPRFYYCSQERFKSQPAIHSFLGDSRIFLTKLIQSPSVPRDCVFFYLDAHWQEDLPLARELEIIAEHWTDPVIMIDDFQVPDDAGYGFDDYGAGKRLSVEYLPEVIKSEFRLFWPVTRGEQETGLRRGCVVAGRDALSAKHLKSAAALREITKPNAGTR